MSALIVVIVALVVLFTLLRREMGGWLAAGAFIALAIFSRIMGQSFLASLFFISSIATLAIGCAPFRQMWLTPSLFKLFKKVAPKVSATEQVALDAGTVGWDGELFSGQPDWKVLLDNPYQGLTTKEHEFLNKQCAKACAMCASWENAVERADLSKACWDYLKNEKFFGMIIPESYGGLGFSARAQSAVLQKLMVNEMLMITVGVPNSLGPGELLLKYGTQEQKDHYLPRLADGREIPCFGLTGPRAGSDATSIPDVGIICKGQFEGKEVIGIKLNFEKRWITLAPIATVVGLAFRLFDPDKLLNEVTDGHFKDETDLGITCALIPRDTQGMDIGRRHQPIGAPFMNGPIIGKDVFIPLDWIIGGVDMVGQGWRMLVECLSVGRCITLPSGAAGSGAYCTGYSGGYTRIRRQFNVPVADMEGVQEPLARMASMAYISRAAVQNTANMIDAGQKPAVPSAILKSQLTEFQRQMAMDAMDVHGGKAVTLGPRNYLGISFASTPVSITVEGANIMTRNLMIFGQGAIRCHKYVLSEIDAKERNDINRFDGAIFSHVGLVLANAARSLSAGLGFDNGQAPLKSEVREYGLAVNRYSAVLGLLGDVAMATLGGSLKLREMLSARLGDIVSNLYLTSMVLKQYQEGEKVAGELEITRYSCEFLLKRIEEAITGFLANLPNRPAALALKPIVMPLGRSWQGPKDHLTKAIAQQVSSDSALRTLILSNTWQEKKGAEFGNPLAEYAELLTHQPIANDHYKTLQKAFVQGKLPATALHPEQKIEEGLKAGIINDEDAAFMRAFEAQVLSMLTVDAFEPDEIARNKRKVVKHTE